MATGASARYLGIPGEEGLVGHGLTACATCDGAFYRGVPVCVVGGGDSACEEAMFLTRFASRVYLIHRRDTLRASKIMAERTLSNEKIFPMWNSTIVSYKTDDKGELEAVMLKDVVEGDETELLVKCVFMAIGHTPNTSFLGDLVDRERLEHYLQIFQSSSPSYLIMAGMERCLKFMEEKTEMTGGRSRMDQFYHRLVKLRKELGAMKRLRLLEEDSKGKNGVYDLDISKVIISARGTGINGEELGEWLRRDYHLEMEMCAAEYVTAITTVMDTEEGLRRLRNALLEIDGKLSDRVESQDCGKKNQRYELKPETVMSIADGWEQADKKISLEDSVGRISGEYIYLYPPGIPFVVPGEKISQEVVDLVKRYQKCGYSVQGMADQNCKEIRVVR